MRDCTEKVSLNESSVSQDAKRVGWMGWKVKPQSGWPRRRGNRLSRGNGCGMTRVEGGTSKNEDSSLWRGGSGGGEGRWCH